MCDEEGLSALSGSHACDRYSWKVIDATFPPPRRAAMGASIWFDLQPTKRIGRLAFPRWSSTLSIVPVSLPALELVRLGDTLAATCVRRGGVIGLVGNGHDSRGAGARAHASGGRSQLGPVRDDDVGALLTNDPIELLRICNDFDVMTRALNSATRPRSVSAAFIWDPGSDRTTMRRAGPAWLRARSSHRHRPGRASSPQADKPAPPSPRTTPRRRGSPL